MLSNIDSGYQHELFFHRLCSYIYRCIFVEACVAERLTPGILDLEVLGSSVVSLDKELCSTLSLFTQRHNWVHTTGGGGVTLR